MPKYKKDDEQDESNVKKEKQEVSKWLTKIAASKQVKKQIAAKYRWMKILEEYRGNYSDVTQNTDIYIPPLNLIYAYVKSEIPSLYLRDPKIKVNPKKGSSILSAKILEKALNYIWRTKRIKRENKKNVFDVLTVGHSWFKTGYTGKFGAIEDGNGNTFEFIEDEDFFGYRVPYENITFNLDANDPPYDCTWIAHEVWIPLEELKANKSFKNVENLKPTTEPVADGLIRNFEMTDKNRVDPDVARVRLYEVWDKKSQQIFTITDGCEYFIREPRKWPYDMKGFPFSFLRLNEDPFNPYGIPDCYTFEPQVLELMKVRATELDHLKRFNRQLLLAKGHMDDDQKAQFMQGITGAVLEVRTDGRSISDIATPVPYPSLQTDIYAIEDRLKDDILNVSGQSANDRGAVQRTNTRTKAELIEINKGGENRRSDKIDTIEDFIEDIASNLVALLQQLADVPFFIQVTGDDAQAFLEEVKSRPSARTKGAMTTDNGFTFSKEDIEGEFDFEVVAGSTTPLDQSQKMKVIMESIEMLPKVGVMPGGPVTKFFGNEFADELDMPGLKRAIVEEQKMAEERAAQAAAQQETMVQINTANEAAKLQIKAEREATRQEELQLRAVQELNPLKQGDNNAGVPI